MKDLRPIALTPVLANLSEGIVCEWLEELSPDGEDLLQFGCANGTSTTHFLIEPHQAWCMATDDCGQSHFIVIIIIYLYSVQLQPWASHRRFYDGKSNKNVFRSRLKADRVRS